MSEFHESFDPALDEQLRSVRIPRGLLVKLRRIARANDAELDLALGDVAVPKGLLTRLRDIPALSDAELIHCLNDVPVPQGLLASLRRIGDGTPTDDELDAALQNVPVPMGFMRRARRAIEVRQRVFREIAVAACLFIAVWLSYMGSITGLIMAAFGIGSAAPEPTLWVESQPTIVSSPELVVFELAGTEVVDELPEFVPIAAAEYTPALPTPIGPLPPGPSPMLAPLVEGDLSARLSEFMVDVNETKWGKFLASQLVNEETDIPQEVDGPRPGGMEPIFAKGYDPRVHAKFGVHPFVSALSAQFQASRPPLTSKALSYEHARRDIAAGRRLDPETIRIEEFLAAPDYALPKAPRGQAQVRMFGGASPFAGRPQLVQIAVNVGDAVDRPRTPVHLVVAVDISESMSTDGRLSRVRQSLERLIERMKPRDLISIIAFNEDAVVLAEQLERRDHRYLVDTVRSLEAAGATNLGSALQLAYSIAQSTVPLKEIRRRIVVVGDGRSGLTPDAQFRVVSMLSTAVAEGIDVRFVDHSNRATAAAPIAALARSGGCSAAAAATEQELDWALSESLTGDSQVVLSSATLEVHFNPAVVARYRLIGHGSQIRPAAPTVDLRGGQVATVLYEVETFSNVDGWVARAEVSWRDSASREPVASADASLTRSELDTAFVNCAPPLQLATVAAELGEALRRSPYLKVPIKQALASADDAARLIATDVRELPRNQQLIQFLAQLRRVRSW